MKHGIINVNRIILPITVDSTPIDVAIKYPKNEDTKVYTIWATVEFSEIPHSFTAEWAGNKAKTFWETNTTLKVKCKNKEGKHTLVINAYDEAGNLTTESIRINMVEDPLPLFLTIVTTIIAILGTFGGGTLFLLIRKQKLQLFSRNDKLESETQVVEPGASEESGDVS